MEKIMQPITRDEVLTRAAKHHVSFVAFAFGYLRNWSTAEDVVQESYLVISKKWESYRPETSIKPWGRSIIRFLCLMQREANKKEHFYTNDYIEGFMEKELESFSDHTSTEYLEQQVNALLNCMSSLSQRSIKLLHEFYIKGRMCKDIARDEGKHEKSPVIHLYRLRNQLRKCIRRRISASDEANSNEALEIMDNFFTESDADLSRVANLIESNESSFTIVPYLIEWAVFATAINLFNESEENPKDAEISATADPNIISFDKTENSNTRLTSNTFSNEHPNEQKSPRTRMHYFCAIAACVALLFALSFRFLLHSNDNAFAVITSGSSTITQEGSHFAGTLGQQINQGAVLTVDTDQTCTIELPDENTSFEVTGPSELQFTDLSPDSGRKIFFISGEMLVTMDKQSSGAPFEIETEHSVLQILGTRFILKATPSMTIISLENGRIMAQEKNKGEKKILTAGNHAEIESGNIKISASNPKQIEGKALNYKTNNTPIIVSYPFDEGAGREINDYSGSNHHGYLPESLDPRDVWIRGPIGSALFFGKLNRELGAPRIFIKDVNGPVSTEQLTLSFWINCFRSETPRLDAQTIISLKSSDKFKKDGLTAMARDIENKSGYYRIMFSSVSDNGNETSSTERSLAKGEWHHIAFNFNAGTTTFYVNGEVDNTREINRKSFSLLGSRLSIGLIKGPYEVGLDNVILSQSALTADELNAQAQVKRNL